jgi:predicted nucleic acid-binding protein
VIFVDTNVLVYSTVSGAPFRLRARRGLVQLASNSQLYISRQILREYLAAVTRPQTWGNALTLAEAIADTVIFARRFVVLEDGPQVWDQLMKLSQRFVFGGRQVHDAAIVATMRAHGISHLLTFNDADFRRFADVIELVPLPAP